MLIRTVATASCLCIVMGLLGCNKSPSIKTVPVSGTVKYKDQPVVGAIVSFLNTPGVGKNAGGVTDSEGKFTLTTYIGGTTSQDGAVEGNYTVTVAWVAPSTTSPSANMSPDQAKAMQEKMQAQQRDLVSQQNKAQEQPASPLPAKYAAPDTTPFKDYAVKAGEKNDFELVLADN